MTYQPTLAALSVGSLPLEIWSSIFDVACLDDGFTARSLSLVSRRLRALSEGHRYHTIKISSTSQIVALEKQLSESGIIAARGMKTRFVSITLLVRTVEEVYPMSTPGMWAPSSDSGDSDYQDLGLWDSNYPPSDDSDAASGSEAESDCVGSDSVGQAELSIEIADIQCDEKENEWKPAITRSIEDLNRDPNHSVAQFHYLVYGAMRRLLEACSNTLEVLSIHHNPAFLIQFDVLVPPLPRLRHLSIGLSPRGSWATMSDPHPMQYPSLQVLRLMGWPVHGVWWRRIIESIPDSSEVKIISVLRLYR